MIAGFSWRQDRGDGDAFTGVVKPRSQMIEHGLEAAERPRRRPRRKRRPRPEVIAQHLKPTGEEGAVGSDGGTASATEEAVATEAAPASEVESAPEAAPAPEAASEGESKE